MCFSLFSSAAADFGVGLHDLIIMAKSININLFK